MFSPSGSKLLSVGEDTNHSFALYDWMDGEVLASAQVSRDIITGCDFKTEHEFAICAVNSVKFWTVNGYNCLCSNGILPHTEPLTAIVYGFTKKICLTGTANGNIIIWDKERADKLVEAHKKRICTMITRSNTLITGCEDGHVVVWDHDYSQLEIIDVAQMINQSCIIRSMDLSSTGSYLIGTSRARIIEIAHEEYKILVSSHSDGEVWGLCTSPTTEAFITCAGDKFVRLWEPKKLLAKAEFSEEARACDWAGNGKFVAIGFVNGEVVTVDPENCLAVIATIQSSFEEKKCISDIKIAPSCKMIAYGAETKGSRIEVLKVAPEGRSLAKYKYVDIGLTGALAHLDWDVASAFVVVNSANCELVYVSATTCSVVKPSACSETDWNTWTCTFGFPVKGLAENLMDSMDVNTVCRSSNKQVLALGDDCGRVKLFKCPYIDKHATYKSYIGHSSRVAKVAFMGENYLISIGCKDRAAIVWKVNLESTFEEEKEEEEKAENYSEAEDMDVVINEKDCMMKKEACEKLVAPSSFINQPSTQVKAPKVSLRAKYVYGYKGKNCKKNLSYLKDMCMAYNVGTLGIVHDMEANTQRFFNWHKSEIVSVAFHPDGRQIATGERQAQPSVYVWDSTTCDKLSHFQGQLAVGVRCLAYSASGDYLAAVDMSSYHVLAIYDTSNSILLAMSETDRAVILDLAFKGENELVTVGVKHFMLWKVDNKCLTSRKGVFADSNDILGCVAADKELLLTGNKLGEIYKWSETTIESKEEVHTKPVDCITIAEQMYTPADP